MFCVTCCFHSVTGECVGHKNMSILIIHLCFGGSCCLHLQSTPWKLCWLFSVSVVSAVTSWNFFSIWTGQKWTSIPPGQDFCVVGLQTFLTCSTALDPGSSSNFTPIGGPVTHLDFSVTSGSLTDVSTMHSQVGNLICRLTAPSLPFSLVTHS